MVNKPSVPLIFLLMMFSSGLLGGLEISRGQVKLTLHESSGRFSLYYSKDLSTHRFTPLFVADDPSTSGAFLQIDGKETPLVAGSDFRVRAEATATGGKFIFTSSRLTVEQNFDFLSSPGNTLSDAVRITYVMTNQTTRALRVVLKVVLDTYLGEKADHFVLKDGTPVRSELTLSGQGLGGLTSSSPTDSSLGLFLSLDSSATTPSQIILANWKRINTGGWEIQSIKGRDFNLLPYSFNDSALAVYYPGLTLEPAEPKPVVMNLGSAQALSLEGARLGTDNAYNDILESSREVGVQDLLTQLEKDKVLVNDLLGQISQRELSGKEFTEEDLKILQAILDELNRRKVLYR